MKDKVTVNEVYTSKSGKMPTLLHFQNGQLAVTTKDNVQFCTMLDKQSNTKSALVVAKDQIYDGAINASEANELSDTYICVRNKSTNKVRIIPIEQAQLKNRIYMELQQKHNKAAAEMPKASDQVISQKLLKEFGGRRATRFLDVKEKMQVSVEIIKDDLEVTVQETSLNETNTTELKETRIELICPKFNKEAKSVKKIYDINDLVPPALMKRLEDEAKAVLSTQIKHLPIKSQHLLSCIERLQNAEVGSAETFQKVKIIIYMDCLQNMINTRENALSKVELSGITEKVETDVRSRFADSKAVTNPMFREKALCHYIVLCLLIDDHLEADTNILAQELNKAKPIILQYAHIVNALPKVSKSDIITLKLPSKVPELRQKGRKMKK